jgi:hypothetical protein
LISKEWYPKQGERYMKRIILRSIVLTLSIGIALSIADLSRKYLDKSIDAGDKWEFVEIGVLILITLLLILGDWVIHRIKRSQRRKKSK